MLPAQRNRFEERWRGFRAIPACGGCGHHMMLIMRGVVDWVVVWRCVGGL